MSEETKKKEIVKSGWGEYSPEVVASPNTVVREPEPQKKDGGVSGLDSKTASGAAPAAQPTVPATTANGDSTPLYQRNANVLRDRAGQLRDYAGSPVKVDTTGQRDYLREFLDSPLAKRQETDEQRKRREKRERTNRRILALADGLIGLTNVIGAANGATAFKQTPLSAAHKQAVDEAVKRREALRQQYEVALANAKKLDAAQAQQNADRRAAEEKLRREAAKQADDLEAKAGTMENEGAAGDRKFGLDQIKAKDDKAYKDATLEETKRYHDGLLKNAATRNSISASKGSGRRGGSGKDDDWIWGELADWEDTYDTEVKAKLEQNGVTQYDRHNKTISKPVVRRIIAEMRNKYGSPSKPKKASVVTVKGKKQGNSNYKGRFN